MQSHPAPTTRPQSDARLACVSKTRMSESRRYSTMRSPLCEDSSRNRYARSFSISCTYATTLCAIVLVFTGREMMPSMPLAKKTSFRSSSLSTSAIIRVGSSPFRNSCSRILVETCLQLNCPGIDWLTRTMSTRFPSGPTSVALAIASSPVFTNVTLTPTDSSAFWIATWLISSAITTLMWDAFSMYASLSLSLSGTGWKTTRSSTARYSTTIPGLLFMLSWSWRCIWLARFASMYVSSDLPRFLTLTGFPSTPFIPERKYESLSSGVWFAVRQIIGMGARPISISY
mmetsp:Transcript_49446/g.117356  ORF Transcript_49446/g.117356 Transcript_49446/m.117356 type:complete len:287 (+) Transcript_49446:102-962(+)